MKRTWLMMALSMGLIGGTLATNARAASSSSKAGADTKASAKADAADAQDDVDSPVDRRVKAMTDTLKLNKSQQAEVRKIWEENRTKTQDIRRDADQKRRALRTETETRLAGVLKPDQKDKFEEMKPQLWRPHGAR
jgi:Spy/CpxP family protein refolding chaperone